MERSERVMIIVLDEIDALVKKHGDDILYKLTRVNYDVHKSKISIVGITNDVKFIDGLDPRVRSSLGEEELVFPHTTLNNWRISSRRGQSWPSGREWYRSPSSSYAQP